MKNVQCTCRLPTGRGLGERSAVPDILGEDAQGAPMDRGLELREGLDSILGGQGIVPTRGQCCPSPQ